jgi:hypothetical protein
MKTTLFIATAMTALASSVALAEIVVDGTLDAAYGDAIVVQNTPTGFGDSNLGTIDYANGSELANAHGVIADGYLYLFFGGNLESNFNKFEVFIDFQAGGQNKLRGDNPDVDFNGLNRMGNDGSDNGLTFDEGFEADYYVTTTCGGGPFSTFANTAQILTKGGGVGEFIGSGGAGSQNLQGSNGTIIGINNSNTAGVTTRSGDGFGVSTGVEIAIPLNLLVGYDGESDVKVTAFVNGGGHDFLSNQVAAPIGGGGNLGEPRLVNFSAISGDQFFVVPGPNGGGGGGCTGDVNGDLAVDASDLAFVLGAWGTPDVDLNDDGTTDATDLAIVLGAWGACP